MALQQQQVHQLLQQIVQQLVKQQGTLKLHVTLLGRNQHYVN